MADSKPSPESLDILTRATGVCAACWQAQTASWLLTPGLAAALGDSADWHEWSEAAWLQHLHHEDAEPFLDRLRRLADSGTMAEGPVRLRHADGGWRWFRCHGSRNGGQSLLILQQDTEARQERAALVDSQMRLRSIYDAAPVAIILWSRDGRITDWNQMAETLFGHAQSAAVGRKLAPLLIAPADYDRYAASVAGAVRSHGLGQLTCRSLTATGSEIVCDWRTVALRGPKGVLQGLLSLAIDVTAVHEAEAALRRARDEAESLSQAKSEFLSVISHELRTPLNGVLGMAQLLELTVEGDSEQYVNAIRESGEGLLAIVNGIVQFTEIDARPLASSMEVLSPADTLELAAERHAMTGRRKGLAVALRTDGELPPEVIGDRRSLEKVLDLLLDNAVKFTDTGSIEGTVRAETDNAGSLRLCYGIRDTGIGMTPAQLDKLFIPFQQGENAIVRRHGGVGLGLALAKKLVDRMGGRLIVTSQPGQGSDFLVSLPVARPPPDDLRSS